MDNSILIVNINAETMIIGNVIAYFSSLTLSDLCESLLSSIVSLIRFGAIT